MRRPNGVRLLLLENHPRVTPVAADQEEGLPGRPHYAEHCQDQRRSAFGLTRQRQA